MEFITEISKLDVDGNKIVVCQLEKINTDQLETNLILRSLLVDKFKGNCDIVVLLIRKNNYCYCKIFECNNGRFGSFTPMCGNGLKAAATICQRDLIKFRTDAGIFLAQKNDKSFLINVGKFINDNNAIKSFIKPKVSFEKFTSFVIARLSDKIQSSNPIINFGFNAENKSFIGEPHLVFLFRTKKSLNNLISMLKNSISVLKNNSFFREEVNITFSCIDEMSSQKCLLKSCTFERNMGDNPEIAITGSCGTGAMAVANSVYAKILKNKFYRMKFNFKFPKGKLKVLIKDGISYLYGKEKYQSF